MAETNIGAPTLRVFTAPTAVWRAHPDVVIALAVAAGLIIVVISGMGAALLVRQRQLQRLRLAEAATQRANERLQDFALSTSDWFWEMNASLELIRVVDAAGDPIPLQAEDKVSSGHYKAPCEDLTASKWRHHFDRLAAHQPFRDFRYTICLADGGTRHISLSGRPVFDDENRFTGYRGTARDVTNQHATEQALRDAEERRWLMEAAVEHAPVGITLARPDDDQPLIYANAAFEAMTGYSRANIVGRNCRFLQDFQEDTQKREEIQEALSAGLPIETVLYNETRSGQKFWNQFQLQPIRDQNNELRYWLGIQRDITTEIESEQAAKRANEVASLAHARLVSAVESLDDGFVLYDAQDRLLMWNSTLREICEPYTHRIRAGEYFIDIMRECAWNGLFPAAEGQLEAWLSKMAQAHRTCDRPIYEQLADGRWLRFAEHPTPEGGRVGFRVDITDLVHAQRAAEQASRAKSRFLAMMSHELRTPLNAVLGYAQLLNATGEYNLTADQKEYVQYIASGGQKLLELIEDVLDMARVENDRLKLEIESVPVMELVAEITRDMQRLAQYHNVTLTFEMPAAENYELWTDERRTRQILTNLISNAIKYNRSGGTVTIDGYAISSNRYRINVRDTGIGIPESDRKRVFELFERSDGNHMPNISGVGIGLALVYRFTEALGGSLDIQSEIDHGTVVTVDLPLAAGVEPDVSAVAS